MLYGQKERFGIEFELNDDPGGAWMFGKFCYWINGEQVGSFCEGTSLRDVLFSMKYIVGDTGSRTAPSLAARDATETFRLINEALAERNGDIFTVISRDVLPACFDVCPNIDIFGSWNVYLIDSLKNSKIIYSGDGGNTVKAAELMLGEFDTVASTVCEKLNGLLEVSR